MKHPLIDINSAHYDTKDVPHIQKLEHELSVSDMAGFCYGNISKYKYRQNYKGQKESDIVKIEHYTAYFDVIKKLLHKGYKHQTVSHAMELERMSFDY